MFKTEAQQCRAIQTLLASQHMERFWTDKGPTRLACDYLEGSPLSSGEQVLLRCAFDFWNGEGKVTLYSDLGRLDSRLMRQVLTLALATNEGSDAVEHWIAGQFAAHTNNDRMQDVLLALVELTSAVQDAQRRYAAGDPNALQSNMISATVNQALTVILKANV